MFTKEISLPISPLNMSYMSLFTRPGMEPDYVLSTLGIILLKDRIEKYSGIDGRVGSANYKNALDEVSLEITKRQTDKQNNEKSKPAIFYYMAGLTEDRLNEIKTCMDSYGLTEIKPVEAYVKQELEMSLFAAYISEETNSVFVFAPTTNLAVYHLCWAFLPLFLPGIFKEKPLTETETAILKSLSHKTHNSFIELVSNYLTPMKAELLRSELQECFENFRNVKIENARLEMQTAASEAEAALTTYQQYLVREEEAIIRYEGLKAVNAKACSEQENEAIEYLVSNPCIHNVKYSGGRLEFITTTLLTNIDVMKFRNTMRNNDIYNCYKLDHDNPFYNKECRKIFLDALFNNPNPELSIKVCGYIYLNVMRNSMDVARGRIVNDTNKAIANCIENPHYKYHGCPGQNRSQITQCLAQNDLVSAIECSIAATGSVNIAETDLTFRPFIQEVLTSNRKIIHRNDGTDMTPVQALYWLMKKTEENVA